MYINTCLCVSAHDYILITDKQYEFNQIWFTTYHADHFIFYVKACHDPHILLSDNGSLDPMEYVYEVALGISGNLYSKRYFLSPHICI